MLCGRKSNQVGLHNIIDTYSRPNQSLKIFQYTKSKRAMLYITFLFHNANVAIPTTLRIGHC